MIKIIRLKRGLETLDMNKVLTWFKKEQMRKLEILIDNDHKLANSKDIDQINIGTILLTSFFLKVVKIMLVIFSCSYFFAMIFKICLDIQNDYCDWDGNALDNSTQPEHFTHFYGLDELEKNMMHTDFRYQIIILYFSFTTLSTVGFGDYVPRSDMERILIAFGLMFGVAIFSYVMGEFILIIKSFSLYNDCGDQDDRLATFFGVMS